MWNDRAHPSTAPTTFITIIIELKEIPVINLICDFIVVYTKTAYH
jgi:hypothetical protein